MSEVEDREPEVGRELYEAMMVVKVFEIPISRHFICHENLVVPGLGTILEHGQHDRSLQLSVAAVDGNVNRLLAC